MRRQCPAFLPLRLLFQLVNNIHKVLLPALPSSCARPQRSTHAKVAMAAIDGTAYVSSEGSSELVRDLVRSVASSLLAVLFSVFSLIVAANFYRDFDLTWSDGKGKVLNNGQLLTLSLDKASGSGFQSSHPSATAVSGHDAGALSAGPPPAPPLGPDVPPPEAVPAGSVLPGGSHGHAATAQGIMSSSAGVWLQISGPSVTPPPELAGQVPSPTKGRLSFAQVLSSSLKPPVIPLKVHPPPTRMLENMLLTFPWRRSTYRASLCRLL
ncbi:hypothetical protein Taro_030284 [Colocasia esculenta]|uniref:CASP-like protein n=1 Tax=Colocasia esculenta TaxID=4460 RepID=A0A843VL25_COLES|nr:hypothetical protein [Colocasia esculenta]